jgi:hypothetical protein
MYYGKQLNAPSPADTAYREWLDSLKVLSAIVTPGEALDMAAWRQQRTIVDALAVAADEAQAAEDATWLAALDSGVFDPC